MPVNYPPTALTTIFTASQQQLTYKPILLVDILLIDGVTALHLATDAVTHNAIVYEALITKNTLDQVQKLTSIGIDAPPACTVEIADPAASIFSGYELNANGTGIKGATITLTLILLDKITGTVSSNSKVKFVGRADPPSCDDRVLSFKVKSKLDLARTNVPNVPISKLCPYPFPGTPEAQATVNDRYSVFFPCGYPGGTFTTCNYDRPSCIARGMFALGRFGGVQFEPPSTWINPAIYTTGAKGTGWNTDNQAKYQQYVPLTYGPALIKGIVANVMGTGNDVRFEVIVGWGDMSADGSDGTPPLGNGGINMVIVNNVVIPHWQGDRFFHDPKGPDHPDPNFNWQYVNNGSRNGAPNGIPLYNGLGDPYGSMMVVCPVVNTTVHNNSNAAPDVLIVTEMGKKVRVFNDDTSIATPDPQYSVSRPIWIIMDLLVTVGAFTYADFDIVTAFNAQQVCSTLVPNNGVGGPFIQSGLSVAADGVTVTGFGGGGFQSPEVIVGTMVQIVPGQWNVTTAYIAGQYISLGVFLYVALADNTGQSPDVSPTFWQVSASIDGINATILSIQDQSTLILVPPGVGGAITNGSLILSHPRYRLNLILQARQALNDLLNSIKLGCNLNLVVNNQTNKLQFFIDQGLGDQQPAPVVGSNDNTPYPSYLATGAIAAPAVATADVHVWAALQGALGPADAIVDYSTDFGVTWHSPPAGGGGINVGFPAPNNFPLALYTGLATEFVTVAGFQMRFFLAGTTPFVSTQDTADAFKVYDAAALVTYADGSTQVIRPTSNYIVDNATGAIVSPEFAYDDDTVPPTTFGTATRFIYSADTEASYMVLANWGGPITGGPPGTTGVNAGFDGRLGVGYVAYHFNEGNIILEGNEPNYTSSLKLHQMAASETPNRIITPFQNEEIKCESDTSARVDADDYQRMKQTFESTVRMEGVPNFDQLFRRANNHMARMFRGNPRSSATYGDTGGTIIFELKTPGMQVSHLRVGHIVALSSDKFGLGLVSDSGNIGQLFRVQAIKADDNFNIATITMAWHDDRWFLDSYGKGPAPQFRNSAQSVTSGPPYGWIAYGGAQPFVGDTLYAPPRHWQPGIQVMYEVLADNSVDATVRTFGRFPVNKPAGDTASPYISLQGSFDIGTGTVPPGHYYVAICAIDTKFNVTFPQLSKQLCQISLAATGSLIVPRIVWAAGAQYGAIFAGTNPHHMEFAGYILPVSGVLPTAYTIASLDSSGDPGIQAFPTPDPRFDHVQVQAKLVRHAGPVGVAISSIGPNTVTVLNAGFVTDQWAAFGGYSMAVIGIADSQGPIPLFNSLIISNTDTTLTLVLNPEAAGITPGSVMIIYSNSTVSTDANGNTVLTDPNWANSLGPVGNQYVLNNVIFYQPLGMDLISTLDQPVFVFGDHVRFRFDDGTTFTAFVALAPSYDGIQWLFGIAQDTALEAYFLINPNAYVALSTGLAVDAEIGSLVRFINADGTSATYKIKSNTGTTVTIDGAVPGPPANGSLFLIEEPDWHSIGQSTQSVSFGNPLIEANVDAVISNFEDKTILVQTLLMGVDGQFSVPNQSPFRMVWVYGQKSLNLLGFFTITVVNGFATIDLANGLTQRIVLTSDTPITINAPIFTGGQIVSGMTFTLLLDQDATGHRPKPIFVPDPGGFVSNTQDQLQMDGTPSTRSAMDFKFAGGFWSMGNQQTGVAVT